MARRVSIRVDTSGCSARRSHHHQPADTTTPPTAQPSVAGDVQPHELPCVIANRIADRPGGQTGGTEPVDGSARGPRADRDDDHHDGDDDDRERGGEPEDAVIPGVPVHQQPDHHQPGATAEAQRPGQHRHRRPHPIRRQLLTQDRDADRIQREGGGLQHPAHDQQCQRRCDGREHRADQHHREHDQQYTLLAVQVGQPADQRCRRGGGQ